MSKFRRGLLLWGIGLMLGAVVLMGVNCANIRENIRDAEEYTKANKITLTTMIGAGVADVISTDRLIKAGGIERHFALGDKPSTLSLGLWGVLTTAGKWYGGHMLPPKWRNWLWGALHL